MFTNVFKKSKPINYLLLAALFLFTYYLFVFTSLEETWNFITILKSIALAIIFLASAASINVILLKDQEKGRHTFVIYLFLLFSWVYPELFTHPRNLITVFLVILGIRQAVLMRSTLHLKKKLFNSFFLFAVAGLLHPPALLFTLLPFFSIFYFAPEDYRNWLIFIPAIFTVFTLKTVYTLIYEDRFFNPLNRYELQLIEFTSLADSSYLYFGIFLFIITAWALFQNFSNPKKSTQKQKKANSLLPIALVCALIVFAFSGNYKSNHYLPAIFCFIPCALILGKYFEDEHRDKIIKEVLLIAFTLIALYYGITFLVA